MSAQIVNHRDRQPATETYVEREWNGDDEWIGVEHDELAQSGQLWDRVKAGEDR